MSNPCVVVTRQIPTRGLAVLGQRCALEIWGEDSVVSRDWLLDQVGHVEGILCLLTDQIDKELLDQASRLRVVSTMAVGFDNIDVAECTKRGIPVGHTPGILTETTADLAFALLMAAARQVVNGAQYVQQGQWKTWSPTLFLGQDLHGATLGIVGFGRIGQAVARRAKGFGMRILACGSTSGRRSPREDAQDVSWVDLDTLLTESDFVSLHVPLTNKTYHLIGKEQLQRMKPTAILVNTARGTVIDSQALFIALSEGTISYAALDVTDPEPIPRDHPLLTLSNCLIVPHIASASTATRTKMAVVAAENLLAGLIGERLPHCVNPEIYA